VVRPAVERTVNGRQSQFYEVSLLAGQRGLELDLLLNDGIYYIMS